MRYSRILVHLGVFFGVSDVPPVACTPKCAKGGCYGVLAGTKIKQAKPLEKDYKLSDEKGLFLLVKTNGSKYWRFKYRIDGKEKLLALGVYPEVTLKVAREQRDKARSLIANGVDPNQTKKASKISQNDAATFGTIAHEWYAKQLPSWADATAKKRLAL